MKPILEIQNISKKFRINHEQQPYLSIRDSISNMCKTKKSSEDFWAIKDVSFDVQQGDTFGIIGKNGAGKSTLLKILSRITPPTSGKIIGRGRVASLLEVGTGFHPELSGRENIFMNGSILGMRRTEILRNFNAIVDFAGVEKFIDTPLKHYSSGMQLRLAFAVAAFLENEILIIDEVLAVGDAEFQKKCMGKMGEVSQSGRTILFVSHNMTAVKELCSKAVLLQNGSLICIGNTLDVAAQYQRGAITETAYEYKNENVKIGNENIHVLKFSVSNPVNEFISVSSDVNIKLSFYNHKENINLAVGLLLKNNEDLLISEIGCILTKNNDSKRGLYTIEGKIPGNLLNAGNYHFNLIFGENQSFILFKQERVIGFEILNETIGTNTNGIPGILRLNIDFSKDFYKI